MYYKLVHIAYNNVTKCLVNKKAGIEKRILSNASWTSAVKDFGNSQVCQLSVYTFTYESRQRYLVFSFKIWVTFSPNSVWYVRARGFLAHFREQNVCPATSVTHNCNTCVLLAVTMNSITSQYTHYGACLKLLFRSLL